MKKGIKIFLFLGLIILLVGCNNNKTAGDVVGDYLQKYINSDQEILEQLNDSIDKEFYTDEQKKVYKDILIKQYRSLNYEIVNEEYNGDKAKVTARIKVIDLYTAQKKAVDYLGMHADEFLDEKGNYDKSKFISYKLDKMKQSTNFVEYNIIFNVLKQNNQWEVLQLGNDDLEKIHGIYGFMS